MGDNVEQIKSGDRIADRYVLSERIGAGGFGETWKAHDELLDVDVAVKVFADSGPEQRDRYLHEARSLAQYSKHPGIAAVRDFLAVGDRMCLVMEYVVGVDLVNVISANGQLDLQTVLVVLGPVADALASLHEAGLLHRDVSPDNIRVRSDGKGVLLDFGSVLAVEDTMRRTIMVKPGYAPPEQYGDASMQGSWTDVYALAATAYHALTGQVPSDSLKRTFTDDLRRPSALGVNIPKPAEDALMRALELDYRKRTKSVGRLMASLAAAESEPQSPAAPVKESQPEEVSQPRKVDVLSKTDEKARPDAIAPVSTSKAPVASRPRRSSAKRRNAENKRLLIVVGVVVLAVIGIICGLGASNTSTDYSQSDRAKYSDVTMTDSDVQDILADANATTVELSDCAVTDEQIEQIAKKQGLASLSMYRCTGFTTLAPLSECSTCKKLYLGGLVDADLDALFPKDMPSVEELSVQSSSIANLGEGLTRFPSLVKLELGNDEGIVDIGFLGVMQSLGVLTIGQTDIPSGAEQYLAGMPNLYYASLDACNLSSLDWAVNCPKLSMVSVEDNDISDVSPLANHERLNTLRISNNNVEDITALGSCTELHELLLSNNKISDISSLASCEDLWTLAVNGNSLQDLHGLENHDSMSRLNAQHNSISDATSLVGCSSLQNLNLAHNTLTSLDFCDSLVGLVKLDASHCQIADTKKLATCAKMIELYLQDNQITDLSALQNGFTDLAVLNVAVNKLTSLKDLSGCSALKLLVANNNEITSLGGLEEKPSLEVLMLDSNQISDISALSNSCAVLHDLDLGHNKVASIDALSKMGSGMSNSMVRILLDHNQVADVNALPKVNYNALVLYGNPLRDFSSLAEKRWNALYLPYVEKANYGTLGEIGSLSSLRLVDVPYDRQVQTLRDMGVDESGRKPVFLTEEKADDEMRQVRDEVNKRASGMGDEEEEPEDGESDGSQSDSSGSEEA